MPIQRRRYLPFGKSGVAALGEAIRPSCALAEKDDRRRQVAVIYVAADPQSVPEIRNPLMHCNLHMFRFRRPRFDSASRE